MPTGEIPANIPSKFRDAWVQRRIDTDVIPQKNLGKQPLSETLPDAPGRLDGDPYGNRTRVSAVKGPRPNR